MKTSTFKEWKAAAIEQKCTQDNEPTTANESQDNEPVTSNESQDNEPTRPAENLLTIAEQPVEIVMSDSGNQDQEIIRMNLDQLADMMVNIEDQANEIIAELREDPDLRDIMNNVDRELETRDIDEGIEISALDDIEYDVEPFDFEIEVENYQW